MVRAKPKAKKIATARTRPSSSPSPNPSSKKAKAKARAKPKKKTAATRSVQARSSVPAKGPVRIRASRPITKPAPKKRVASRPAPKKAAPRTPTKPAAPARRKAPPPLANQSGRRRTGRGGPISAPAPAPRPAPRPAPKPAPKKKARGASSPSSPARKPPRKPVPRKPAAKPRPPAKRPKAKPKTKIVAAPAKQRGWIVRPSIEARRERKPPRILSLSGNAEAIRSRARRAEAKAAKQHDERVTKKKRAVTRAKRRHEPAPQVTDAERAIGWLEAIRDHFAGYAGTLLEIVGGSDEEGESDRQRFTRWIGVGRFDFTEEVTYETLANMLDAVEQDYHLELDIGPNRMSQIRITYHDPAGRFGNPITATISNTAPWAMALSATIGELVGGGGDGASPDSLAERYKDSIVPNLYIYFGAHDFHYRKVDIGITAAATVAHAKHAPKPNMTDATSRNGRTRKVKL